MATWNLWFLQDESDLSASRGRTLTIRNMVNTVIHLINSDLFPCWSNHYRSEREQSNKTQLLNGSSPQWVEWFMVCLLLLTFSKQDLSPTSSAYNRNGPFPLGNQYLPQQSMMSPFMPVQHQMRGSNDALYSNGHMSRVPALSHQNYLKYSQSANIQYNPYNSNVNPHLMARPMIESLKSTSIQPSIADAIARGRDKPLYSSVSSIKLWIV